MWRGGSSSTTTTDNPLTASAIVGDGNISYGSDENISLTVFDTDGINTVIYNLYNATDTNHVTSLLSGYMADNLNDGNYTATLDTNTTAEGNYTVVVVATGVGATSVATRDYNFSIISTPTISLANQTVNDNGGFSSTDLPAPTVTNVNTGAVYSIVSDPTGGKLTINSSTGVATWNGDLFAPTDYTITIKVTNSDGGSATTTFTLHVNDNA